MDVIEGGLSERAKRRAHEIRVIHDCIKRGPRAVTRQEICNRVSDKLRRSVSVAWLDYRLGLVRDDPEYWGFMIHYVTRGKSTHFWKIVPTDSRDEEYWDDDEQANVESGAASHIQAVSTGMRRAQNGAKQYGAYYASRTMKVKWARFERKLGNLEAEANEMLEDLREPA